MSYGNDSNSMLGLGEAVKSTLPVSTALWNYQNIADKIQTEAIIGMLNCQYDWQIYEQKSTPEAREHFISATTAKIANQMKLAANDLTPGSPKYNEFIQNVVDSICNTFKISESGNSEGSLVPSDSTSNTAIEKSESFLKKIPMWGWLVAGAVGLYMVFGNKNKPLKKRKKSK